MLDFYIPLHSLILKTIRLNSTLHITNFAVEKAEIIILKFKLVIQILTMKSYWNFNFWLKKPKI